MAEVRPVYLPLPYQDDVAAGRVILRDGSTAAVRVVRPEDCGALEAFFARLSPESRQRRFFSAAPPTPEWIKGLCDDDDPKRSLTLIVSRTEGGAPRIIATGSYFAMTEPGVAEVAFAVADAFHGKGLGTVILERLALLAVGHGFRHFWAVTHADNERMMDLFRESGFEVGERLEGGSFEVDLALVPSAESVARTELRDRVATAASLRPFFRPNAVAVVGASRDPGSIGFRVLEALVRARFAGPVYPVNPKAAVVGCIRAYPSVRELPEPVDLAVVCAPRDAVPGVIDDCAARSVRAVVVVTAGFAEMSGGRDVQKQLVEKVRGYGMRMIGPNCLGILNADPAVRLNASFSPVFPPAGRVAMSSQSGALGLAILAAARRLQLGLSTFVSVGNKADVSGNDLLQYWEEDPGTDVILLYLESFGNPRRFARIARRVGRRKPVVAVKSGRTQAGRRAAGSHTAALAASDVAVEALFRQAGVLRAETLEEMFGLAAALSSQPLPPGRRVAVVTNAGGPGILCADACEAGGLTLPELPKETVAELASFLPAAAGLGNPVDMIASAPPEHYRRTVEAVLACGTVDALIVIYVPVGLAEPDAVAAAVAAGVAAARARGGAGKPVLTCLMPEPENAPAPGAGQDRFPVYTFPESAARTLAKMAAYAEWRAQSPGVVLEYTDAEPAAARAVCKEVLAKRGPGWLSAEEARQVLGAMRLPLVPGGVARSADEAVAIAAQVGYPVAVKAAAPDLVHKTEAGGVRLRLAGEAEVRQAFADITARVQKADDGALVQKMAPGGVEVFVGVTHDPLFGPLLAFGLGGIHVEVLGDVCFRITPLTDRDAAEMVRSIKGYRLLQGYRGHPAADVEALQEVLLRLSRLVEEVPEVSEIDLNPIMALPPGEGCLLVDAKVRVGVA